MLLCVARLAKPLRKAGKLEVHRAALLERHARLEEAARLAPQPDLHAEAAQGGEELRIAGALEQPGLAALDALVRLGVPCPLLHGGRQLGVELDELRRPLRGERSLED